MKTAIVSETFRNTLRPAEEGEQGSTGWSCGSQKTKFGISGNAREGMRALSNSKQLASLRMFDLFISGLP